MTSKIEQQLKQRVNALKQKINESYVAEFGSAGIASLPSASAGQQVQQAAKPATIPSEPTKPITWKDIYNLNKDTIGTDPNKIRAGASLKMPDGSTYTVQAGDNLSKIAKKYKPISQAAKPAEEPQWKPDTGLSAGPQPGPSGKIGEKPWDATIEFNKMLVNPPTAPDDVKQLQAWLNTRGVNGIKTAVNGVMDDATKQAMQKYKEYLDRAFQYESKLVMDPALARIIELVKR